MILIQNSRIAKYSNFSYKMIRRYHISKEISHGVIDLEISEAIVKHFVGLPWSFKNTVSENETGDFKVSPIESG